MAQNEEKQTISTEFDLLNKKAIVYVNTAYILADVVNGVAVDLEGILQRMSANIHYGELKQFKKCLVAAQNLKAVSKKVSSPIYNLRDVDSALDDSDWLQDIIHLIIDRVGDNREKANEIVQYLRNMKSELNLVP